MSVIVPAILSETADDLTSKINFLSKLPGVTGAQIDIVDGHFANNKTILPNVIPSLPLQYMFTAHMMVTNPTEYFQDIEKAGFESVAIHYEAFKSLGDLRNTISQLADMGIAAQLAVNPETEIDKIALLLKDVDSILIMAVHPGHYGMPYLPETENRVRYLRTKDYYGRIVVDGGVEKPQITPLLAAGADELVVGSAIFKAKDPRLAYLELRAEAGEKVS